MRQKVLDISRLLLRRLGFVLVGVAITGIGFVLFVKLLYRIMPILYTANRRLKLGGPEWIVIIAIAAVLLLVCCVTIFPKYLVRYDAGGPNAQIDQADMLKAKNDARTTLLHGVAAGLLLVGAFFTWRQVQDTTRQVVVAQQGQITEGFTRAIDQLGSDDNDVRLGGVYALERLARDSEEDRVAIAEVLVAYIRRHAPTDEIKPSVYNLSLAALRNRAPDVQAAITALGRRVLSDDEGALLLADVDLRNADLRAANLNDAWLADARLEGADLRGATLENADLGVSNTSRRGSLWCITKGRRPPWRKTA